MLCCVVCGSLMFSVGFYLLRRERGLHSLFVVELDGRV